MCPCFFNFSPMPLWRMPFHMFGQSFLLFRYFLLDSFYLISTKVCYRPLSVQIHMHAAHLLHTRYMIYRKCCMVYTKGFLRSSQMKQYTCRVGHALNGFHLDIIGLNEFVNACIVGFQFVKVAKLQFLSGKYCF